MSTYSLIGIGHDCSPAAALRSMGLRQEAYPFDWVQTHSVGLRQCISDDFLYFHRNLRLMDHRRRMIDHYGFQYPHDYPIVELEGEQDQKDQNEKVGEGIFTEEMSRPIVSHWSTYYDLVKEKYDRRIQRFRQVFSGTKPIILFSRYPDADARVILTWFREFYQRNDIYMINSAADGGQGVVNGCITVWTEQDGIWNHAERWKEGLDALIHSLEQD